jgi:pyruvate dehydrogenase E1 component alpha subunit
VSAAVARARAGGGPTFIEAKTYRYRGHSRTDPAPYRKPGELDEWRKRDPITLLGERMMADGELDQARFDSLQRDAESAVDDAARWAMAQPYPTLESVSEDIWA